MSTTTGQLNSAMTAFRQRHRGRIDQPGDEGYGAARDLWNEMIPHACGVDVNDFGIGEAEDRVRAAYDEEKYARLVELKNRYDPANLFRFNQNIKPRR